MQPRTQRAQGTVHRAKRITKGWGSGMLRSGGGMRWRKMRMRWVGAHMVARIPNAKIVVR